MNENPLVTVIIPTHNRSNLLPRAIRSVLTQTYKHLECIVVDDASTDNTEKIIQDFNDPRLFHLRHEVSLHASAARNTGIKNARGELIAFLDDDDEWMPQKLEKQVTLLKALSEDFGMIYCWFNYYEGNKLVSQRHPQLRGNIFKYVLDTQPIGNSSTLIVKKSVIDDIGSFDESLPRGNDSDFISRICYRYNVDFIPEVLVKVYINHEYSRISNLNNQGIVNRIKAYKTQLSKFDNELEKYPRKVANIYALIGYHYALLSEWKKCFDYFQLAIHKSPINFLVFIRLLNSISVYLFGYSYLKTKKAQTKI